MTADAVIVAEVVSLSAAESDLLAECEATIDRGMQTFIAVGIALAEVRDSKLYRATHKTFVDYCCDRWQMSARHAGRTIGAANMAKMIMGPNGSQTAAPENERQIRPLARLLTANEDDSDAAQQEITEAWSEAVATAPVDPAGRPKVTAKHVEKVVARRLSPPDAGTVKAEPKADRRRRPLPEAFRDASDDMVKALKKVHRLTQDDRFAGHAEHLVRHTHDLLNATGLLAKIFYALPSPDGKQGNVWCAKELLDVVTEFWPNQTEHDADDSAR